MDTLSSGSQKILMIRPVNFGYNPQTAIDNVFQKLPPVSIEDTNCIIQQQALTEFDTFVTKLVSCGIEVVVVEDTPEPPTPDAVFPNNWISFHSDGSVCLFPMFAENRRLENKPRVLEVINQKFQIKRIFDFTHFVAKGKFLEGTGSMVLDRENKIIYASRSGRMNEDVLHEFASAMDYSKCVIFSSRDEVGGLIYHTNVMMTVGDKFAVICLEVISDFKEREMIKSTIEQSGKEVIDISFGQMKNFAGNILQVHNTRGENFLVMSTRAYNSLTENQKNKLKTYNQFIHTDLSTIEAIGGGSARCMMAEIYLQKKDLN